MKSRLVAVIEIGSTGIRLLVTEIFPGDGVFGNERDASGQRFTETGQGGWREVDRAGKPVTLGWDVFTTGEISRESFLECLSVLHNFRELLGGWEIAPENIHVIATSALRAARNRDIFADRVKQETGFSLLIVEGVEENRLMYLAVRFALKQDLPIFWRANSMIIEVGGGSTELMLLRRGKMVAAHSLRLGTIMIDRQFRRNPGRGYSQGRFMRENLRNTMGFLNAEMDLAHVRTFVALGSEARIAAALVGAELNEYSRIINRDDFIAFAEKVESYGIEECVQRFHISYEETEGFVSGMQVYKLLLERTHGAKVAVPLVSIREGYLLDLAMGVESELREEFYSQIIAGAVNLGRRYHFDEAHNLQVAKLCMLLFDALIREHGMNRRERMMLETAAILHDIGKYIKNSGHQLHGQYIVANSEIFGLRREELAIIANVIRYHRGPPPQDGDIDYIALQREERVLVLKMASILRVAEALDRGHSQNIRSFTVEKRGESLVLQPQGVRDLSLELIGLEEKAGMFQDVFGYKVVLG
jgi:exopolyphosphatase/guanosine-5'-triphosphate,3'-diphosphate pyrophosphatase